jgi:hypothetical protein
MFCGQATNFAHGFTGKGGAVEELLVALPIGGKTGNFSGLNRLVVACTVVMQMGEHIIFGDSPPESRPCYFAESYLILLGYSASKGRTSYPEWRGERRGAL